MIPTQNHMATFCRDLTLASRILVCTLPISFLVEALFVSTATFDDDVTEVYLTPGIRLGLGGQRVSLGVGVQIPLGEDVDDFANADYFIDLMIRFGS